ncbi:MAG: response regulator [Pseudomonadota bacterium]
MSATTAAADPHIALVEDDQEIRDLLQAFLEQQGLRITPCRHGDDLDRLLARATVDLVVLDIMMPGEDGLSICKRLSAGGQVPVILLSGRGDDVDRIVGLEIGADDYLPKPCNPRELMARIRAVLRRRAAGAVQAPDPGDSPATPTGLARERYRFAAWVIDVDGHTLSNPDGEMVVLSQGEFELLTAFVRHPRRVLSRDQLLDWTRADHASPVDRAIDVQLSRLRRKLGDEPRNPTLIKTVRGGGYLLAVDVEALGEG